MSDIANDRETYERLARRLCAAFIASHMGLKSVDYALTRYASGDIGDFWIALARDLTAARADVVGAALGMPAASGHVLDFPSKPTD